MASQGVEKNKKRPMPYKIYPPTQTPKYVDGESVEDAKAKWFEYLNRIAGQGFTRR